MELLTDFEVISSSRRKAIAYFGLK